LLFFSVCKTVSFSRFDQLEALDASFLGGKGGGNRLEVCCGFSCFVVCYIFILLSPSEKRRTFTLMCSNVLNGPYARKMKNVLIPLYLSSSSFEEFAFPRYSDATLPSYSPTSCHACAPASDPLPQIVAVPVQNTPVTWHSSRRLGRFICNHTFGFHAWCWHPDVQIYQRLLYLSLQLPAQQRYCYTEV